MFFISHLRSFTSDRDAKTELPLENITFKEKLFYLMDRKLSYDQLKQLTTNQT